MVANDIKIRRRALLPTLLPGLFWGLLWIGLADAEEAVDEPRWYQVELVIFAHQSDTALDSERWPEIAGVTLPANLRQLSLPLPQPAAEPTPTAAPEPFLILADEEMQLNDVAARIARSKRFEPLLHIAWRQPTLADEQTQPILLYDGMTAPYTGEEIAALQAQAAETQDPSVTTPVEQEKTADEPSLAEMENIEAGPVPHRLIGTVRLSVARYLHLDADLLYRTPVTQRAAVPVPDLDLWYDRPYPTLREPQGPAYLLEEWHAVRGFRLQESRRMRSKEIHYLDNPFFGMVVLVTPFETKPKEPKE